MLHEEAADVFTPDPLTMSYRGSLAETAFPRDTNSSAPSTTNTEIRRAAGPIKTQIQLEAHPRLRCAGPLDSQTKGSVVVSDEERLCSV